MDLNQARAMWMSAEEALKTTPFVVAHEFTRNDRRLQLVLTARLVRVLKRARLSRSKEVFTALKNASYGFDPSHARSESGRDGIFIIDRDYEPRNEMMRKIFDRFLDHASSDATELARFLNRPLADLVAVRLVSHHLRLLGVLCSGDGVDVLALVDVDRSA